MENMLTEIQSSLVKKSECNTFLKSVRLMDAQELSVEIQKNIAIWQKISNTTNFYQTKLTVGSAALRDCEVNHIGFKIQIPSTLLGELYENFTWTFDIEGNSDVGKLKKIVYERTLSINNNKNTQTENTRDRRIFSLFFLDNEMQQVFNLIDSQLQYSNPEQAIILTSLAFYEIELLSKERKNDYMLHSNMYNLANTNDKWIAFMNVEATYTRPTISNIAHLVH